MRVIIRRFIELLLAEIILSVIAVGLNAGGLITERQQITVMLIVFTIIYIVLNVLQLRFCYEDLYGEKQYYGLNFGACVLFLAVTFICYSFMPNVLYSWLFSLMKVMYYLGWDEILSMMFFFALIAVSVVAAPIGINWIMVDNEEDMRRLIEYGDEFEEQVILYDEDDDIE